MAEDEGFVVRLRGLPWAVTDDDILKFFGEIQLSQVMPRCDLIKSPGAEDSNIVGGAAGIHMTYTREGRPTGEGYLELGCEEDVEKALTKHNEHLGPRYIEGMRLLAIWDLWLFFKWWHKISVSRPMIIYDINSFGDHWFLEFLKLNISDGFEDWISNFLLQFSALNALRWNGWLNGLVHQTRRLRHRTMIVSFACAGYHLVAPKKRLPSSSLVRFSDSFENIFYNYSPRNGVGSWLMLIWVDLFRCGWGSVNLIGSGLVFPDRLLSLSANLMCDEILGQGWR